jgi:hypothetical protein
MSKPSDKPQAPDSQALSRRRLFAGAGTAGALAAAAVAVPLVRQEPAEAVAAAPDADAGKGGYRLTEHIERYYQTARV